MIRAWVINLAVRVLRRYFVGRTVTREAGGMIVVGRVLAVDLKPRHIEVLWVPHGGDLRDSLRIPIQDLIRSGRDWIFVG